MELLMPKRRFVNRLPEKSGSRSRVVASLIWRLLESGPTSLGICCLLIAFVSVHDAALIVTNHEVIYEMEQNPIGVWLLDLQDGQVWLFVTVKLICTALVCAVLITLYKHQRRMAMTVAASLVCFQLSLLCYLSVA